MMWVVSHHVGIGEDGEESLVVVNLVVLMSRYTELRAREVSSPFTTSEAWSNKIYVELSKVLCYIWIRRLIEK